MQKFQIFADSCSDLPTELREQYNIGHLHMNIVVDGVENIADLDWKEYSPEELYNWMKQGKKMKTTQVPVTEFVKQFRPALEKGLDIIYVGCSSKLSASVSAVELAKQELLDEFKDRRIVAVDSLNASGGLGMMIIHAAQLQQKGKSFDEVVKFLEDEKLKYNLFATTETLTYLKNAGRVKASKALLGNLFHKKPIIVSGRDGNNVSITTVTGTKNADKLITEKIIETADKGELGRTVFVGQGDAKERAAVIKARLEEAGFHVVEHWIGPIIGISCGPGVIILSCYGKEVIATEDNPKFQD